MKVHIAYAVNATVWPHYNLVQCFICISNELRWVKNPLHCLGMAQFNPAHSSTIHHDRSKQSAGWIACWIVAAKLAIAIWMPTKTAIMRLHTYIPGSLLARHTLDQNTRKFLFSNIWSLPISHILILQAPMLNVLKLLIKNWPAKNLFCSRTASTSQVVIPQRTRRQHTTS